MDLKEPIPLFKVYMSKLASESVSNVLNSGYITQGPEVEKFEDVLRNYFLNKHVVTFNSATSGLHLIFHMLKEYGIGKDGIKIGMVVLEKSYLVGQVIEVNYTTSRAILISDLNSKIPVTIMPGNVQSILTGTGKTQGEIQYQMEEKDIEDNSIVYTSGSGGIFKSGIPIGKITENSNIESIKVKYFSNLSQLNFVKVVSFNREDN